MKNQNTVKSTQEEKAMYFAQYLRQPVYVNNNWNKFDGAVAHLDATYLITGSNGLNEGFLMLTSLADIIDEDAIHCANLLIDNSETIRDKDEARKHYWRGLKLSIAEGSKAFIFNVPIYQYLQSKGYALPWMGYSVEQLISFGWLKLKQKGGN